jgi:MarR family transcriptional regulator, organic hydroperoxide resistance regulator
MAQAPFDSSADVQEFGELLSKMIRSFISFERSEIFCCGVTMSQCSTILAVGKKGKMTMNELSEWMSLATSTMTRIVDNLVRDGYIERIQDEQDRRVVCVSLTRKGMELFEGLKRVYHEYHRRIVENIPADRLHKVVECLTILKGAIEKTPLVEQHVCTQGCTKET